ncbi:hypothetical protein GTA08_BOTSDO13477 [Neofusicoccum parvum]|nr:hypothetical protein GTA08_BOTSDO13477 [Neofusicoccum parvum]
MSSQGQAQSGGAPPGGVPPGPPYAPQTWALGGRQDEDIDIPVTAVFLALYTIGAIGHMAIFKKNLKQGHKFLLTLLIFAGVLLIYIINLVFAQRLIRAQHPRLGWSFRFGMFFKLTYVVTALTLIMVITVTVQSFYTLSVNTRRIDRDIQLYCSTFFAYVSFLPFPLILLSVLLPRRKRLEKFGTGKWRTKIIVLLAGTFIVCLGACYRCGTAYLTPVSVREPLPSYYSRACFYIFNFGLEILVIYLYLIMRIDRRFHIPNGAKGPGQYARGPYAPKAVDAKKGGLQSKKHDSVHSGFDRASTLNDDSATPRTLNLKTDFSSSEKGKLDLEAQNDPHSAISGTTAALSKDHLLLPESPKAVHIKSEKHRSGGDVPPVPALPPSATGALPPPASVPLPSSGAASTRTMENEKLDKVVDLLVSLDRRLSYLEEAPRRDTTFDLLDRLNQRLSRLEEPAGVAASPLMRPQSSAGTTLRGDPSTAHNSLNDGPAIALLDRLDRRLSRLEDHEARTGRHSSGIDTLMMLDRRMSHMESRVASPERGMNSFRTSGGYMPPAHPSNANDYDMLDASMPLAPPADNRFDRWNYGGGSGGASGNGSPHLRGGAGSPHRFSQSPSRFSARATGPVAAQWPLEEEQEQEREYEQYQYQQQHHPEQLRPGFARAPPSTDSMGTVTLNNVAQDELDDEIALAEQHPAARTAAVGRAFTPDDDQPHHLAVAVEQPLRYSTSVASATSQYSQATEVPASDGVQRRDQQRE